MLRICTYNIAWFDRLFESNNSLKQDNKSQAKLNDIKEIILAIDPDILGIVEAPNTSPSSQRSTKICLENFAQWAGLRQNKALIGYPSAGRQELAIIYDPTRAKIKHSPGGRSGSKSNPKFNQTLLLDTDDDGIKEVYKFYRPPLEVSIRYGDEQTLHLILVHTKSKGIFSATDMIHWQRQSERNRRKLFAECTWIRRRADEWLKKERRVIVMGDMNDGPGMDFYEKQFGRSAYEIIMGDVFEPRHILSNYGGRPKWGPYGWSPATARFKDRFTEQYVNVFIDHILASQNIAITTEKPHVIWNPKEEAQAKPLKQALKNASDHYPITLDIL